MHVSDTVSRQMVDRQMVERHMARRQNAKRQHAGRQNTHIVNYDEMHTGYKFQLCHADNTFGIASPQISAT